MVVETLKVLLSAICTVPPFVWLVGADDARENVNGYGGAPADPVAAHTALRLELAYDIFGLRAEQAVDCDRETGRTEALLNISYRVAAVPASEQRPCCHALRR